MNRSRQRLLIVLLLPLLALRAMVPAGFMPVADAVGLRLVICPDGMPAMPDVAHDRGHDAGHSHGHDHGHDAGHGHDNHTPDGQSAQGKCLFALSAFSAPPIDFSAGTAEPIFLSLQLGPSGRTQPPASGPPRQPTARGPPASA